MSILGKKWLVKNTDQNKSTLEKILKNRGTIEEQDEFHDPFLFNDMEKALARIDKAIKEKQRIIIFGDYDVDGISGTAILVQILNRLNAEVSYRIPHRVNDGYGFTEKFIPDFVKNKVNLVITVDCGISCHDVIKNALEQGIETIVTDHHSIPENIPPAVAILHPKLSDSTYPYKELTGSGVAFKLAHALIERNFPSEEREKLLQSLVDLASLGTVADLGPITGENRLIVRRGLKQLRKTEWIGLRHLMNLARIDMQQGLDASSIGYRIGPRINAAGRIGNPYIALSLLLQKTLDQKTQTLGQELESLNTKRLEITTIALEEALDRISNQNGKELPEILIAESPDWHVGIVGLIAGRLTEKYGRPSIIMQDMGDKFVASARSPGFFDITQALKHCSKHLISFGGHVQAAGFSLKKENLEKFKSDISAYAKSKLADKELVSILNLDCELNQNEIGFDLVDKLDELRPFGIANSKPSFCLKGVEPLFVDKIGKEGRHLKFTVNVNNKDVKVIAFSMGEHAEKLKTQRKIDLACHLERNTWNNRDYLQLHALDIKYQE